MPGALVLRAAPTALQLLRTGGPQAVARIAQGTAGITVEQIVSKVVPQTTKAMLAQLPKANPSKWQALLAWIRSPRVTTFAKQMGWVTLASGLLEAFDDGEFFGVDLPTDVFGEPGDGTSPSTGGPVGVARSSVVRAVLRTSYCNWVSAIRSNSPTDKMLADAGLSRENYIRKATEVAVSLARSLATVGLQPTTTATDGNCSFIEAEGPFMAETFEAWLGDIGAVQQMTVPSAGQGQGAAFQPGEGYYGSSSQPAPAAQGNLAGTLNDMISMTLVDEIKPLIARLGIMLGVPPDRVPVLIDHITRLGAVPTRVLVHAANSVKT